MTLPIVTAHQPVSAVVAKIDLANMVAGSNTVCSLPPGAIVVGGLLAVIGAYTAACTLDIGDAGIGARYANDVNIAATGVTALTLTGYEVTAANGDITITPSAIDPTSPAGALVLIIHYVVSNRESYSIG